MKKREITVERCGKQFIIKDSDINSTLEDGLVAMSKPWKAF